MNTLKDKTAYITGGTKGIGYAVAAALLSRGANTIITGRKEESALAAADRLNGEGYPGRAIGVAADVRDLNSQATAIQAGVTAFGGVDFVIANAGIGHFAPIQDLSAEQWQETIDVNLTGVFNSVKAGLGELVRNEGYLITIASLAGTNFFATGGAYNASKFGLVGFSQAIMLDLRPQGVKVSTIMPGSVSTFFNDHTPSPEDAWKIQPEDIGQIVVDLLQMPARTLPSKVEVRPSKTKGM